MKLGHVSLDGTKVRANASKHKAMSYKRMKEKEAQLAAEVAGLLRKAQEADDEGDRRYGADRRGDELPAELAFREGRIRKIREAMAALEAKAREAAEQASGRRQGAYWECRRTRLSATSPIAESRIMPGAGRQGFRPGVQLPSGGGQAPTRSSWRPGPPTSPRRQGPGREHD